MRIISQNGMDFPYEQVALQINDTEVFAYPLTTMKPYLIARYSSAEKASRALIKFYESCSSIIPNNYFEFPQEDEI